VDEHTQNDVKPSSFSEWKETQKLTDAQIAERITARGVPVKRAMISAILRGERSAGNRLAFALRDETGLPIEQFLLVGTEPKAAVG